MANAKFSAIAFKLSLKRTMKNHKERAKQMAKGEESGFRSAKPKKNDSIQKLNFVPSKY